MQKQLFRQYDIRGKIGSEIKVEDFYNLAHAVIHFLQQQGDCNAIVLGMDGRVHSNAIYQQIAAACKYAGIDIYFLGVCSTPITMFAHATLPVQACLMITASHNPAEYNGLKISYNKQAVEGEKLQQIYELFKQKIIVQGNKIGNFFDAPDVVDQYVDSLVDQFAMLKKFDTQCFIDCGNGTAGPILEKLIEKMGWSSNIKLLFSDVDGTYPNHVADPTDIENMEFLLHQVNAHAGSFGIGLDGDCDRVALLTARQGLVPADRLLTLFAQDIQAKIIVADIKSSSVLNCFGAQVMLAPTGCANIIAAMIEHDALIGGELSGHFFFKDRHAGYDDGIYGMLRFFEILMKRNIISDDLVATLPATFATKDIRIPCADDKKFIIVDQIKLQLQQAGIFEMITIDGVRFSMQDGWALIRAANTQPMISVCCQAVSFEKLQAMKKTVISLLQEHIELQLLQQYIV